LTNFEVVGELPVCPLNLHCNPAYAATHQTYQSQALNV